MLDVLKEIGISLNNNFPMSAGDMKYFVFFVDRDSRDCLPILENFIPKILKEQECQSATNECGVSVYAASKTNKNNQKIRHECYGQ